MSADWPAWWSQQQYKNRVLFLSGSRDTFQKILDSARQTRALESIEDELKAEKTPADDPQWRALNTLRDRVGLQFTAALKEAFDAVCGGRRGITSGAGPFHHRYPKSVIRELSVDNEGDGRAYLKVEPLHAPVVVYETGDAEPTPASSPVPTPNRFEATAFHPWPAANSSATRKSPSNSKRY